MRYMGKTGWGEETETERQRDRETERELEPDLTKLEPELENCIFQGL